MNLTALITAAVLIFSQGAGETAPDAAQAPKAPLEQLYAQLAAAETQAEADRLTSRIALVWTDSGSDTVNLLMNRAEQATEEDDAERAARRLDDALALEPDFAEAWNRRAMLYLADSEPGPALEAINKALVADPKHFTALVGLGNILERMNRSQAAYEAYGEALKINPFLEDAQKRHDALAPLIEGQAL